MEVVVGGEEAEEEDGGVKDMLKESYPVERWWHSNIPMLVR